ncbi:MAG TPA: alpha/beta hydrolase domain-containing protein [Acidimicrobiales bacterium]|nr:alpha/beta hydrolase domain-containing protein [Acidimicrobiales bacterium]
MIGAVPVAAPRLRGPRATDSPPSVLAEHGYVEEEWFVEGAADAYDPDGVRIERDVAYATRLVLRRPADPGRASGTALFDPLHMIGEMPASWFAADWLVRQGHIWVGVSVHNSSFGASYGFVGGIDALKARDPERYASLHLAAFERPAPLRSHPGPAGTDAFALKWDMAMAHPQGHPVVAGVARLLRGAPEFADLGIRRLYGCGASQTANFWRLFVDHGWHERGRGAGGAPPFEAYVLMVSPGPSARPVDAVLVNILSEAEVVGTIVTPATAVADCEQPRVRGYELPGAPHSIGDARVGRPDGDHGHTSEPYEAFLTATLAALDEWVRAGVPMPHVARIARDPGTVDGVVRDEFGNAVGGLRVPWLEAPRAQYLPRCSCGPTLGEMVPFDAERMCRLYPGPEDHARRWRHAVQGLVDERLLLAEDADALVP